MLSKLKEIARIKDELIQRRRKQLGKEVRAIQQKLFNDLLEEVLLSLDLENGLIKQTVANQQRLAKIDKLFKAFEVEVGKPMQSAVNTYMDLMAYNNDYYKEFKAKTYDKAAANAKELMLNRIGLTAKGKPTEGGFIDSFIKDKTIAKQVKTTMLAGVTNGTDIKVLTKSMNELLVGTGNRGGAVEAQFRTYVYDSYSQFDRENSNVFAIELDLNYGVYAGGLVADSREFCEVRNGNVFTRAEIAKFGTPSDKFGGYTNKSKGEFQGKNKDYIPERDCGGYNCGHTLNWVTYEVAKSIRPDIPKYKK